MFLLVSGGHICALERDTNMAFVNLGKTFYRIFRRHMNYFINLILGKAFCIFIFFHFPDSRVSLLKGFRGYMAGNRSRISKHYMTGSPVFLINLTYLRIPTNLNYHMSIKKSQAILKCFIHLKSSVWFTLGSENETLSCDS